VDRSVFLSPIWLVANTGTVGFKKGVNRATTQVLMKTGQVERTNDRDFETEQRY
jgi:amphiphysin